MIFTMTSPERMKKPALFYFNTTFFTNAGTLIALIFIYLINQLKETFNVKRKRTGLFR